MAAGQNQGLQIALIIFVILTVFSMGFAVFTGSNVKELKTILASEKAKASTAEKITEDLEAELNVMKTMIGEKPTDTQQMPDMAATEEFFKNDLKKYGERLKAVQGDAVPPASYSQSIDSVLTVLEQRNLALEAEKVKVADLQKQKASLEGIYQAQVDQFKSQAEVAEKSRAEATGKVDAAEKDAQRQKETVIAVQNKANEDLQAQRGTMQRQIDELLQKLTDTQAAVKQKDIIIAKYKTLDFAATYDGQVSRINPSTRTVWINLGYYDNLQKHLTFSVQAQGVPAGSSTRPKGKVEVTRILDNHLAECRILEDDLNNPILVGDNVYTPLWEPGQRTRFAFAGKIDLDGDGSDDIDRVRALVERAGGQIDAVAGIENTGELTIETRYLVLGPMPADKIGADAYSTMLAKAESLGVQRVPVAVFLDQIGYKRDNSQLVRFGAGAGAAPLTGDIPDGGNRVSNGSVNALFQQRRPPAVTTGSAY